MLNNVKKAKAKNHFCFTIMCILQEKVYLCTQISIRLFLRDGYLGTKIHFFLQKTPNCKVKVTFSLRFFDNV